MSPRAKRTFSREFKLQVVRQLTRGEKSLAPVCREPDLCQSLVRHGRSQYTEHGENAWLETEPGPTRHVDADPRARIAALEAALGRAHLENEFLRQALALLEKKGSRSRRNEP
jgi:transposase-like protein